MSVVVFRKNLMTDGGPAKAHTIGRVSAEPEAIDPDLSEEDIQS